MVRPTPKNHNNNVDIPRIKIILACISVEEVSQVYQNMVCRIKFWQQIYPQVFDYLSQIRTLLLIYTWKK